MGAAQQRRSVCKRKGTCLPSLAVHAKYWHGVLTACSHLELLPAQVALKRLLSVCLRPSIGAKDSADIRDFRAPHSVQASRRRRINARKRGVTTAPLTSRVKVARAKGGVPERGCCCRARSQQDGCACLGCLLGFVPPQVDWRTCTGPITLANFWQF